LVAVVVGDNIGVVSHGRRIIAPPFWQRKAQVVQPKAQFEVVSSREG